MLTTGCQTWLAYTYLTTCPKNLSPPQSTIGISIAAATAAVTMGALHYGVSRSCQHLGVVGVQGSAAPPLQGGPAPCPPWTEPPPV